MNGTLFKEIKRGAYNCYNEDIDDVETMRGSVFQIQGLAKVDDVFGGSKVRTLDKRNYDTSLYACKVPHTLENIEKTTAEISPKSENYGSEANNYCTIEMEESDNESNDPCPPLGI